tara:strand:- start:351 stop:542 length:192 start_codon:yes stop_codon:yes gene_type:complete
MKNNMIGVHLKTNSTLFNLLLFQFLERSKFLRGEENNNTKQLSKENATIKFTNELSIVSIKTI